MVRANVCRCCSKNHDTVLGRFGNAEGGNAEIEGTLHFTGVFREFPPNQQILDYGALGVLRVWNYAFSGTVGVRMSKGNTARIVRRVVNGAWKAARTVRRAGWGAKKENAKGHVRLESGGALHFVRARLWFPLLQAMGNKIGGHGVRGMELVVVCHEGWVAFASLGKAAWKEDFPSGWQQLWLLAPAHHAACGCLSAALVLSPPGTAACGNAMRRIPNHT